ncbi:hypothetical protein SAMN05421837_103127 [Amycolatopsis pretoriensis]|uniref:Uncharacterized protein n=1 Tax=Amycolatopsis pretoriensis TaxID=218821 RepID=A0A1H5QLH1_9PSEU|nr:hypothetical protein [Amycolatopsis pretoriensis]SEF26201.1 hypothetical protein SAMN05421837_103127 [Amycolatopsis pretoriensis]
MPPRAALAWWGATACWFLGSLLGGRRTPAEAAVPLPVAILAYVVGAGLFALLGYGVHRGVKGTRVASAIVGGLGIVVLVRQLAEDLATGAVVHGAFFLAALLLAATAVVLLLRRR